MGPHGPLGSGGLQVLVRVGVSDGAVSLHGVLHSHLLVPLLAPAHGQHHAAPFDRHCFGPTSKKGEDRVRDGEGATAMMMDGWME